MIHLGDQGHFSLSKGMVFPHLDQFLLFFPLNTVCITIVIL